MYNGQCTNSHGTTLHASAYHQPPDLGFCLGRMIGVLEAAERHCTHACCGIKATGFGAVLAGKLHVEHVVELAGTAAGAEPAAAAAAAPPEQEEARYSK